MRLQNTTVRPYQKLRWAGDVSSSSIIPESRKVAGRSVPSAYGSHVQIADRRVVAGFGRSSPVKTDNTPAWVVSLEGGRL